MGKRGSDLCDFIKKGLKKYPNLKKISDNPLIFSIYFPRKTTKLDPAFEQFLKDWRGLKRKPYKYSMAKQAVETALKKSDFFRKMPSTEANTLIYQILDKEEIIEKKKSKGLKVKQEYHNPLSVESSGYGSGGDIGNSSSFSDEDADYSTGDANVANEQLVLVQNIEDSYQVNAPPRLFEDLDTSYEYDLVSVNPNEIIIDQRNNIWKHFENMYKGEIADSEEVPSENPANCLKMDSLDPNADCPMDSTDPYYLQNDFSDLDLTSCEGEAVDWNGLMDVVLDSFPEVEEKPKMQINQPKMQMYHLKEVKYTEDGEVLIFSPNAVEEKKGFKIEPNVKDEPRIAVNNEQMGKISAAIHSPLNIGMINGEIHLCLKH